MAPARAFAALVLAFALAVPTEAQSAPAAANATGTATVNSTLPANATVSKVPLANNGSNVFVPSDISSTCQVFLEAVNSDSTFAECTSSLLASLTRFAPSAANAFTASAEDVSDALDSLCNTPRCDPVYVRQQLSQMSTECADELTAPANEAVLSLYDILYVLTPFSQAICATDGQGGRCLPELVGGAVPSGSKPVGSASVDYNSTTPIAANKTTSLAASVPFKLQTWAAAALVPKNLFVTLSNGASNVSSRLARRAPANGTVATNGTAVANASAPTALNGLVPNATTFSTTNLPFLLLSAQMGSKQLCNACTRNVLSAYVAFEQHTPHAVGLGSSPMLGRQGALWSDLGATCGGGFLQSITTQAGKLVLAGSASSLASAKLSVVLVGALAAAAWTVL